MAERWVEGEVVDKVVWAAERVSLRVQAPIEPFVAGQFTKLGLEIGGEIVARPYSMVNPPHERPLDFYLTTIPGGPLSNRLARLAAGDRVLVMPRPAGFLTLAEMPAGRVLWLMASGTGIGPFLSILRGDEPWRRFERVVLIHAVRKATDLAYGDDIAAVGRRQAEQFAFVPFVSREATDFAVIGRIPEAVRNGRLETRATHPLDPADGRVMLCGNPAMVDDVTAALRERGFKKHRRRDPGQILVETYW